jgi:spore maturation protein CgeB
MNILMVRPGPAFSVADVYRGWHRALTALGHQVADLNLDDRLNFYCEALHYTPGGYEHLVDTEGAVRLASKGIAAACYEFCPDVVIIVSGFYVPVDVIDLIRARGTKVVLIHTESPYEDDAQLVRAAHASINVICDPTNLAAFEALGPAVYLPHAYDPDAHYPGPAASPDDLSDFCFVGTGYESRIALLEEVDWSGIDVALAGNWQALTAGSPLRKYVAHGIGDCIDNDETIELYRGTKVSANIYRREAQRPELSAGWAMGPREVELAATGTFYLTEARGENRYVLPMVPTFDGAGDLGEQIRWYLARPDLRAAIAGAARAAISGRTFHANASAMLALLDT